MPHIMPVTHTLDSKQASLTLSPETYPQNAAFHDYYKCHFFNYNPCATHTAYILVRKVT